MVLFAVTIGQPPFAPIVFVTVYVAGVEVAKFTCPVAVLTKLSPAGSAENVPAEAPPPKVAVGFEALLQ